MNLSSRIQLYRRVSKDETNKYGLHLLDEGERLFIKPTLLCCGGTNTNQTEDKDERERDVSGLARLGHGLLGYKSHFHNHLSGREPFDIVGMLYPEDSTRLLMHMFTHNMRKQDPDNAENGVISESAAQFVNDHITPLVQDETGRARPITEIKAGFRNIHVLAHSYGGTFIEQVGDMVYDYLKSLRFDERQIRDITSQAVVVSLESAHLPGSGKSSFTTLTLLNRDDRELRKSTYHLSFPERIDNLLKDNNRFDHERQLPSATLTLMPVRFEPHGDDSRLVLDPSSHEHILYAAPPIVQDKLGQFISEPSIMPGMLRAGERTGHYRRRDKTGHGLELLNWGAGRHGAMLRMSASSVLTNGMNNAIANRHSPTFNPLPAMEILLVTPRHMEYHLAEDANFTRLNATLRYDERIREALYPPTQPGCSVKL